MANPPEQQDRRQRFRSGLTPPRLRAASLVTWLIAALVFLVLLAREQMDALTRTVLAVSVFVPAVAITLALLIAAAAQRLSEETHLLQGAVEALRRDLLQRETYGRPALALATATEEPDAPAPVFLSQRRQRSTLAQPPVDQPALALDTEHAPAQESVDPAILIRALNFPDDENDVAGFEALRRALAQPRLAALIRAAQDVLTRLAQEGIYMDDLRPDRARPEFWRAFAQGARGPLIAPLGGIRDRSCLAITTGRMRADPGFRAAAHLFLREFDHMLSQFEPEADDTQITALSETRSARAFMLLGRVSGVFSR